MLHALEAFRDPSFVVFGKAFGNILQSSINNEINLSADLLGLFVTVKS
jgi:hypothetical protein